MPFLQNAWYAGAWSAEVGREFVHRTILGEPVLMYRTEAGEPVAIADRCAHRFAPLHRGKLIGDTVECGYHGLCYDRHGVCVSNPQGDRVIPQAARVRSYPVLEKYSVLWIWTGDPDKAEPSMIPDFSFFDDTEHFGLTTGTILIKANYELMTDNLMDLTHTQFLHADAFANEAVLQGGFEVIEKGLAVEANRLAPNAPATIPLKLALGGYDKHVDFWMDMRWHPPGLLGFDVGATPTGRPREEGIHNLAFHLLTPETETSTHYFWGDARTYGINDPIVEKSNREALIHAFEGQDKPMLEAQQANMGTTDLLSLKPVILKGDAGAIRVRRILARLIEEEQAATRRGSA